MIRSGLSWLRLRLTEFGACWESGALRVEHTGSTSVPGLVAKPIIDLLLVVNDSADEDAYVPDLEAAGYVLRIREPEWFEHRMFKGPDTDTNLHVLSSGCDEIERILIFRDWLRGNSKDRDLYARTKLALAPGVKGCTKLRGRQDCCYRGDPRASPGIVAIDGSRLVDIRGRR